MKYAMTWTNRLGGSGKDNEDAARRALELFSKWQPAAGTTFHQFVGRVDGEGGFAIVETDNPTELLTETLKFAPFNVFQSIQASIWTNGHRPRREASTSEARAANRATLKGSLLMGGPFLVLTTWVTKSTAIVRTFPWHPKLLPPIPNCSRSRSPTSSYSPLRPRPSSCLAVCASSTRTG